MASNPSNYSPIECFMYLFNSANYEAAAMNRYNAAISLLPPYPVYDIRLATLAAWRNKAMTNCWKLAADLAKAYSNLSATENVQADHWILATYGEDGIIQLISILET